MRFSNDVLLAVVTGLIGVFSLTLAPPAHAQRGGTITCGSKNEQFGRCNVPWRDAQLVKQESRGDCIRGQSWGVDQRGLWVDRGCRGVFAEADRGRGRFADADRGRGRSRGPGRWQPAPGWDRDIQLRCASKSDRYQMCRVDVGHRGRVRLSRQVSQARCSEGYSWGWNRAGVWVNHGCRADFVVDRRW